MMLTLVLEGSFDETSSVTAWVNSRHVFTPVISNRFPDLVSEFCHFAPLYSNLLQIRRDRP